MKCRNKLSDKETSKQYRQTTEQQKKQNEAKPVQEGLHLTGGLNKYSSKQTRKSTVPGGVFYLIVISCCIF